MRSMLRRWPPRAEPVRTRVFRPTRADVSPAVSPATPPPAITTSYSWFDTQTDPSWFACGTVYHAAKPALSRTSQHSRPTNELCQYTPYGWLRDIRSRTAAARWQDRARYVAATD